MVSIILIRAVTGAISTSRDVALDSIFNIGAIYSVAVFKLRLKTFLFSQAFSSFSAL